MDDHAPQYVQNLMQRFPDILPLSRDERMFFSRLILRTIIRNPALFPYLNSQRYSRLLRWVFSLARWLERGGKRDDAISRLGKERVLQGEIMSRAATINIDERILELSNKRFVFVTPIADAPNFVLGSQPYYIKPSELKAGGSLNDKPQNDSFVGIVLHPRLLLAVHDDLYNDEHIFVSVEGMHRINGIFVKYSSAVVMASPDDLSGAWYWPHGRECTDEVVQVELEKQDTHSTSL